MIYLCLAIIVWMAIAFAIAYLIGGLIRRGCRYPTDPPTRSADDWWQVTDQRHR